MKCFLIILVLGIPFPSTANSGLRVSNVKCEGGWISQDTTKIEVISRCGKPIYAETVSGEGSVIKEEQLMFEIKGKHHMVFLRNGKVMRIETLKKR